MTYDEALRFFAEHSGVCPDVERLRNSVATNSQLTTAAMQSTLPPHNQPTDTALTAKQTILDHYATLEEPKDQSVVRPATVDRMIELWEKGETYNFPYTRAEVRAAERRWIDEERTCSTAPKRVPWAGGGGKH